PIKAKPSPSVAYNQAAKRPQRPGVRDRRESSSVTLLATRIAVFTYRMCGREVEIQSVFNPFRTTIALVKAAKSITIATSAIHIPVRYVCAGTDQPCGSGPPPPKLLPLNPFPPPGGFRERGVRRALGLGGTNVVLMFISLPQQTAEKLRNCH